MNKIALCVISVFCSLCLSEFVVRFVKPQNTFDTRTRIHAEILPNCFKESDYLPFELRANCKGKGSHPEFNVTYRINSEGFRDDELKKKRENNYRILSIGDSFTFGYGVENDETYSQMLERKLNSGNDFPSFMGRKTVEVVNAGFASGYTFDTYYLFLKKNLKKLKTDLVLISHFYNDFSDQSLLMYVEKDRNGLPLNIKDPWMSDEEGYRMAREIPFQYRYPFLRNSHLFHLIYRFLRQNGIIRDPMEDRASMNRQQQEERIRSLYKGIKRIARENKAKLLVMFIPGKPHIANPSPYPAYNPLKTFLKAEKIAFVDLHPYFKGKDDCYFQLDGHWNQKGHQISAEVLYQKLMEGVLSNEPQTHSE